MRQLPIQTSQDCWEMPDSYQGARKKPARELSMSMCLCHDAAGQLLTSITVRKQLCCLKQQPEVVKVQEPCLLGHWLPAPVVRDTRHLWAVSPTGA